MAKIEMKNAAGKKASSVEVSDFLPPTIFLTPSKAAPIVVNITDWLIISIDLSKNMMATKEFGILGTPTTAIMKGNTVSQIFVGLKKYDFLKEENQFRLNELTKFLFEKHEFSTDFRCQNERPEVVKVVFLHNACCNLRGWGGSRNLMKNACPNGAKK